MFFEGIGLDGLGLEREGVDDVMADYSDFEGFMLDIGEIPDIGDFHLEESSFIGIACFLLFFLLDFLFIFEF